MQSRRHRLGRPSNDATGLAWRLRLMEQGGNRMADQPFDAEAYVDAAAALIGLPLDPAHRPGVVLNLERVAAMAALVMEFPLPEETEPAPVYTP
jgi:hypothetical protein